MRAHGERLPDAACLFSPWTDLTCTSDSMRGNSDRDPMLNIDGLRMLASAYAGGADFQTPLISPLYGDLAGLPPTIAFVGDTEILLNDSTRVAERAQAAGVNFELRTYRDMPHVWPFLNVILPEGRKALDEAAAFLLAARGLAAPPQSATATAPPHMGCFRSSSFFAPAAGVSPAKRGEAQRSRERSDLDTPAAGYTVARERALARSRRPLRSLPRSFILTFAHLLLPIGSEA